MTVIVKYNDFVTKLTFCRLFNICRRFASGIGSSYSLDKNVETLLETYDDKIIYSSYLRKAGTKLGYVRNKILDSKCERNRKKLIDSNKVEPFPFALKYLNLKETRETDDRSIEEVINHNGDSYFPYRKIAIEYKSYDIPENSEEIEFLDENAQTKTTKDIRIAKLDSAQNWMSDYELYSNDLNDTIDCSSQYGTPDINHRKMGPPCGGCGALLNCRSTGMPGYLPSELYKGKTEDELKRVTCQRCHFLKNYNIALNVTVESDYYNSLLATLKDQYGLIILLVDLLDFPACIWLGLVDLIGRNRPIFVVGNKVDLLPKDSKSYLNHITHCLEEAVIEAGFKKRYIEHVSLVSAATGYGIEELISALHYKWGNKGNVYIVGCTNVGKSTIFNALLSSDYCKVQATDLIQRATASPWPGTTLKMLRFPILRPSGIKMYMRYQRLLHEREHAAAEKELRKIQTSYELSSRTPTLIGHIGTTFRSQLAQEEVQDPFSMGVSNNPQVNKTIGIDENDKIFKDSKWCYDTPGVMHKNQILDLLTAEEILLTLPQRTLRIRNFCLQPGMSLLVAGLARVDYVEGDKSVRLSLFSSECLPVLVCKTMYAEDIYQTFLGTPVLNIPKGSNDRLSQWPGLRPSEQNVTVIGEYNSRAVVDLMLSSAGWVSVTPFPNYSAVLRHYTLAGRGAIIRTPPLILYGSSVRGPRIRHTPAYKIVDTWSRKHGQLH